MKSINTKKKTGVIADPINRANFNRYLTEISKFRPIPKEEEQRLFKRIIENGDEEAIMKVYQHNLLFVVSVAKQYSLTVSNQGLSLEDLVNEGNIGLYKAILKFNPSNGFKFISYAVWWIMQSILFAVKENIKQIKIPSHIRAELRDAMKFRQTLEQSSGYHLSTLEVFEAMLAEKKTKPNDTIGKFDKMFEMDELIKSLDVKTGDDSEIELNQLIAGDEPTPEEVLESHERHEFINKLLSKVTPKMLGPIIDYYGLYNTQPLSMKDLAVKYKMHQTTVKTNIDKELRRLKQLGKELVDDTI